MTETECWSCGHKWTETITKEIEKVRCPACDSLIIVYKGTQFFKPSVKEIIQLLYLQGHEIASSPEIIEKIKSDNYVLEDVRFSQVTCSKCGYQWIEIFERKEMERNVSLDCPQCLTAFLSHPIDVGDALFGVKPRN